MLTLFLSTLILSIQADLHETDIKISWMTNVTMNITGGGNETDVIVLSPTSNIPNLNTPCLFSGKLQRDPKSIVAVSGCIDDAAVSISFSSGSFLQGGVFDLTIVDGVTYNLGNEFGAGRRRKRQIGNYDDYLLAPSVSNSDLNEIEDEEADFVYPPPNPKAVGAAFTGPLPDSVILTTDISYDQTLLEHFSNSQQKTKEWLDRVIELTKPKMSHDSLEMPVILKVGKIDSIDEEIKANQENIYNLQAKQLSSLTSFFCKDIGSGIVGIAFLGTACRTDGYAININEMYTNTNSELLTSKTFAHELGHNIGML